MERAPEQGRSGVVVDTRGDGRALRVTWHQDAGCVVLSIWRGNLCAATVRVDPADVPALVDVLVSGLAEENRSRPSGRREAG